MEILRPIYLQKLIDSKWNGCVKVITGIRRCGKSYLLNTIFRQHLLDEGVDEDSLIVFELDKLKDARYRNPFVLAKTVREIVEGKTCEFYLFIDEIQLSYKVKNPWDREGDDITFYDMLLDLAGIPNLDVYVTGSNSKMLSKDILTNFRGKNEQIRVHPLSFAEYYNAVGGDRNQAFENYLWYGGMPGLFSKKSDEAKMAYLQDLFTEIYLKDIIEHDSVRNPALLESVLDALCSAVGSLTNASRLSNVISSKMHIRSNDITVRHYMDLFENAFIFARARRFDVKGNRYFDTTDKFYSEDVGLRNARLGFRQQERTHIMENLIYNELRIRGFNADVGLVRSNEISEGRSKEVDREIDFIVNKQNEKVYIQSAYAMPDESKAEHESKPLRMTGDSFRKIIVRADASHRWFDDNGILNINAIDFLLDNSIV